MNDIVVTIISCVFTLAGVIITVVAGNKATSNHVKEQTDLTLYRIDQLEKKQDKHNTLIERMYSVEDRLGLIEERQKVANHRIEDLERKASDGGSM